jgi:hypothetical protein
MRLVALLRERPGRRRKPLNGLVYRFSEEPPELGAATCERARQGTGPLNPPGTAQAVADPVLVCLGSKAGCRYLELYDRRSFGPLLSL